MYSLPMSPAAAKAISETPSEELIAFLKDNGWREAGPFGAYAVRFLSPDPETEKAVIIPISREIADYELLMINALVEMAKHNKEHIEDTLFKLNPSVRLRDMSESMKDYTDLISKTIKDIEAQLLKQSSMEDIKICYPISSRVGLHSYLTAPGTPANVPITTGAPNTKIAK